MKISKRSRLYGLEPFGIGTEFIESLTSYLIRLAEAHSVTFRDLLTFEIAPEINNQYIIKSSFSGGNRFYDGAVTINGMDKNASNLAEVVSRLTGQKGLEELTLLRFKNVFPNRNLLRRHVAWCPICLEEENYYPLIWSFTTYKVCIKHRINLREKCENCDKPIPFLHRKSRIGLCPNCNKRHFEPKNKTEFVDPQEMHYATQINIILNGCNHEIYDSELLRTNLLKIKESHFEGITSKFAGYFGIATTTLKTWFDNGRIPPLVQVLSISYKLDIAAKRLYTDTGFIYEIKINMDEKGFREKVIREKFGLSFEKVQYYLEEIITNQCIVISIEKIARDLWCSKKYLYRNFSELCKLITTKNNEIIKYESIEKSDILTKKIEEACYNIYSEGIMPTRKMVETQIGCNRIFKNPDHKKFFFEILDRFNF